MEKDLSNNDFKRLIATMDDDNRMAWMLVSKVLREQGKLSTSRQKQYEKFIPRWTWERTAEDNEVFNNLCAEGQAAVNRGRMPVVDTGTKFLVAWKDGYHISTTVADYYKNIGGILVVQTK